MLHLVAALGCAVLHLEYTDSILSPVDGVSAPLLAAMRLL